jgi:hypothetical protein
MSINYYSLEIKTLVVDYDILFSGVFGIDEATNKIIKFYSNTDVNTNILDSEYLNYIYIASGADGIFDVNHKRFSEKGTIINTSMPLVNGATKFKIYTIKNVNNEYANYIDFFDGTLWYTIQSNEVIPGTNTTLPKKFGFIINFITSTKLVMPKLRIDKYCELQKKLGLTRMKGCFQALPLSKKYDNYNNNNNNNNNDDDDEAKNVIPTCRSLRNKMKYAEYVRIYGTTQKPSSSVKQNCRFGATYRY